MGLVDDLNRLSELHAAGQLTDDEFEDAKTRLIRESTGSAAPGDTAGGPATSAPFAPVAPTPERDPGPEAGGDPPAPSGGGAAAPPPPGTTVVHGTATVVPGGVRLGALPPTTRLKHRAQGLTAPGTVEPGRSTKATFFASLGCATVVIVFVALMVATAGVAMFPALARLSAPFLCDAPYDHSYVDITSSNPVPGETYIEWTLQCYNDRGAIQEPSQFAVMGIVFAETVVALYALLLSVGLLVRVGRGRRRRGADASVRPDPPSGDLGDLSATGAYPPGDGPIVNPPS
ncbi:MAG: SHOCT domain-containing protein [Microthrixaceae bacterium]|nr:SHOCT domain-containing protein [Microthrixaceae bacterium]